MKYLACFLLLVLEQSAAFVVSPSRNGVLSQQKNNHNLLRKESLLFSTPPDEEDKAEAIKATSFADAGKSLLDAEDTKRMEAMGDFDTNPEDLQADEIARIREAVRKRAEEVGAEKDTASQQYIEEATRRALNQRANAQQPGQLDLSQISTGNEPGSKSKSDWDESLPTMMYDPADDLTPEEQAEADKVGQLPIWEQAITEIKASKWPSFGTVIREVALMFLVVAFTGALIITWDGVLRDLYTNLGMIPRPDEIPTELSDLDLPAGSLDLPDGFTNNMSEDDLAGFTQEMNNVN